MTDPLTDRLVAEFVEAGSPAGTQGPAGQNGHEPGPCQGPESNGADDIAIAPDGYRLTDTGNASRFIDQAGGMARYVHGWGRWIVYRAGMWVLDPNGAMVVEAAKAVPKALMALVPQCTGDEREHVFRAAIRAESKGALSAMVDLARGIPGVIVDHEELDADPYILNCKNGTVDLASGQLRSHDPVDLCTQQCPVAYDPEATAPLWDACLATWQPDPDIRDYLQREAGAGATGNPTEACDIHHGAGGNGKSKFFGAIQAALGSYSVEPHKSLLVASRHEQHATVVASLFRVRLAVASETDAADRLNATQVKNLTGGDRLRARRMREDEWSFIPSHTLCMFSNYRPEVSGQDEGIWRRVRLIPWDVTIPELERDDQLAEKLQAELPGILRWIVEGARKYLTEGFGAPDKVKVATASYRANEDTVARFIADVGVVFVPRGEIPSPELTGAHESWCADAGLSDREHWQEVVKYLKTHGAAPRQTRGKGRFWAGIALEDRP